MTYVHILCMSLVSTCYPVLVYTEQEITTTGGHKSPVTAQVFAGCSFNVSLHKSVDWTFPTIIIVSLYDGGWLGLG